MLKRPEASFRLSDFPTSGLVGLRITFAAYSSNITPAMENKTAIRAFLPLTFIFIISSSVFLVCRPLFTRWSTDTDVLIIGNIILFLATAISFYLYYKALLSKNAQVILRMVYGGILIKLVICLVAAFVYISIAGKGVSKGAIFGCLFLYFVYTYSEVAILMKMSKRSKHV